LQVPKTSSCVDIWLDKSEWNMKSDLKKELQKLRVQFAIVQRDFDVHMHGRRVSSNDSSKKDFLAALQEAGKISTEELSTIKQGLKKSLSKIRYMVCRFRAELKSMSANPQCIEKLKAVMQSIETFIKEFKDQERKSYEGLMNQEKLTSTEIQALERKIESWSKTSDIPSNGEIYSKNQHCRASSRLSSRDIMLDLPPEVADFEKYVLQNGGHLGGWDDYDQETFLGYRQKYKKKEKFLEQVMPALPGKTPEDVRKHVAWYECYLQLYEKKKEAIKRWKELKIKEKQSLKEASPSLEDKLKSLALQRKMEDERQQKLVQIHEWKRQQAAEKAREEDIKKIEKLAEERKKEKEKKKQLELRKYVQQYREAKNRDLLEQKKELERQEKIEKEVRRKFVSMEVLRFREMDRLKTARKLEQEKLKQEKAVKKEKRLESLKKHVEVTRDPSRLLQHTAGWKEKLKDTTTNNSSGPLLHMPHRAIPSWRSDLY
ncbi:coiled-coil domain-containing protein 112-like, partial [Argonauta hians]